MWCISVDARDLRRILVKIASETSGYLRDIIDEKDLADIIGKGASGDTTRRADKIAEETIIDLVRNEGLCTKIVSEEGGIKSLCREPEYLLIVDPLDGSMNYLSKIPYAAVSLAISRINKPFYRDVLAGAVANIFLRETYSFDQEHVYIDNVVLTKKDLSPPTSDIVIVYTKTPSLFSILKEFFKTYLPNGRLRVLGSASLELVYTGLNRISLFINDMGSLRNLDIVAAIGFAERLGKKIVDIHGNKLFFRIDSIERIKSIVAGCNDLVEKFIEFTKARGYVQAS